MRSGPALQANCSPPEKPNVADGRGHLVSTQRSPEPIASCWAERLMELPVLCTLDQRQRFSPDRRPARQGARTPWRPGDLQWRGWLRLTFLPPALNFILELGRAAPHRGPPFRCRCRSVRKSLGTLGSPRLRYTLRHAANQPGDHAIMICGACGTENRPGRKFCASCGASLALGLPGLRRAERGGRTLLRRMRIGPAPGRGAGDAAGSRAPRARPRPPGSRRPQRLRQGTTSERRLVSILFADLVGFTPVRRGARQRGRP